MPGMIPGPRNQYVLPYGGIPGYWVTRAACGMDTADLFFTEGTEHQAKAICRTCPVLRQCAHWALKYKPGEGIWGGMTPDERRTHLKWERSGRGVASTGTSDGSDMDTPPAKAP